MSLPATEASTGATVLPRFVARVGGDAALAFLHDTTTQDLSLLEPGTTALTCTLDEKGRLLAVIRVAVAPSGTITLDGEEAGRAAIVERLARIAPLSGVTIEAADAVVSTVRGAEGSIPPARCVEREGAVLIGHDDGYDVIGPPPPDDVPVIAFAEHERLRINAGRARFGIDVEPGTLVNETPFLRTAVSRDKGCYPGQESVAKVANLGAIRRHVVLLRATAALPPSPAPVTSAGGGTGTLTSTAGTVGIATVPATLGQGAALRVGDVDAIVDRIL